MDVEIDADDLRILVHLHENAEGCGEEFFLTADAVAEATGLEMYVLTREASYLRGLGLVGATFLDSRTLATIWLKTPGESYMRAVDRRLREDNKLEKGKRLGLAALSTMTDVAVKVAVGVLTEMVKPHRESNRLPT